MQNKIVFGDLNDPYVVFDCPHCGLKIQMFDEDVQCGIFRHGALRVPPFKQLEPHSSKEICDISVRSGLYAGCCKPYQVKRLPYINKRLCYMINKCDYI